MQSWQFYPGCFGFQDPDVGPLRALYFEGHVDGGGFRRSGEILPYPHGM